MQEPNERNISEEDSIKEMPSSWWHRVYLAVIVYTIFIILVLGMFSWYFSK